MHCLALNQKLSDKKQEKKMKTLGQKIKQSTLPETDVMQMLKLPDRDLK